MVHTFTLEAFDLLTWFSLITKCNFGYQTRVLFGMICDILYSTTPSFPFQTEYSEWRPTISTRIIWKGHFQKNCTLSAICTPHIRSRLQFHTRSVKYSSAHRISCAHPFDIGCSTHGARKKHTCTPSSSSLCARFFCKLFEREQVYYSIRYYSSLH